MRSFGDSLRAPGVIFREDAVGKRYTGAVFDWVQRWKRPKTPAVRRRRVSDPTLTVPVAIPDFAPGIVPFLGVTAYLELQLYEAATQAVTGAHSLKAKETLAEVAGASLQKHQRFVDELRRRGVEPHAVMRPFTPVIQRYVRRVSVDDWHQHVLGIWLVGGLFEQFLADLSTGISDRFAPQAEATLRENSGAEQLRALLAEEIEQEPTLSDELALWGRRLVGDTLLLSREVLVLSEHQDFDSEKMEPVVTELTASHMRRMDSLGLTA